MARKDYSSRISVHEGQLPGSVPVMVHVPVCRHTYNYCVSRRLCACTDAWSSQELHLHSRMQVQLAPESKSAVQ